MNSKLRVPIGMLLTASVLLVGGLGCSQDKEQEEAAAVTARQTTNVELAVAKRGEIMQRTSLVGHVQALEKAEVFTRVAGRVTNVYVREGDSVHKGQILIQLDDTVQRNKVAEEKAALSRAQASLIQAQAAYNAALTRVEQAQENVGVTDVSSSLEVQRAKQGVIHFCQGCCFQLHPRASRAPRTHSQGTAENRHKCSGLRQRISAPGPECSTSSKYFRR